MRGNSGRHTGTARTDHDHVGVLSRLRATEGRSNHRDNQKLLHFFLPSSSGILFVEPQKGRPPLQTVPDFADAFDYRLRNCAYFSELTLKRPSRRQNKAITPASVDRRQFRPSHLPERRCIVFHTADTLPVSSFSADIVRPFACGVKPSKNRKICSGR